MSIRDGLNIDSKIIAPPDFEVSTMIRRPVPHPRASTRRPLASKYRSISSEPPFLKARANDRVFLLRLRSLPIRWSWLALASLISGSAVRKALDQIGHCCTVSPQEHGKLSAQACQQLCSSPTASTSEHEPSNSARMVVPLLSAPVTTIRRTCLTTALRSSDRDR
jgi:hypothetical protein